METAALFTIGMLRNLRTASILNNVVAFGEDTAEGITSYVERPRNLAMRGERNEILTALEAFTMMQLD